MLFLSDVVDPGMETVAFQRPLSSGPTHGCTEDPGRPRYRVYKQSTSANNSASLRVVIVLA